MGRAWFLASGFPGFQIQTQCLCVSAVEMAEIGRSLALPARRLAAGLAHQNEAPGGIAAAQALPGGLRPLTKRRSVKCGGG